jgi:flagellar hook-length control protein FliK
VLGHLAATQSEPRRTALPGSPHAGSREGSIAGFGELLASSLASAAIAQAPSAAAAPGLHPGGLTRARAPEEVTSSRSSARRSEPDEETRRKPEEIADGSAAEAPGEQPPAPPPALPADAEAPLEAARLHADAAYDGDAATTMVLTPVPVESAPVGNKAAMPTPSPAAAATLVGEGAATAAVASVPATDPGADVPAAPPVPADTGARPDATAALDGIVTTAASDWAGDRTSTPPAGSADTVAGVAAPPAGAVPKAVSPAIAMPSAGTAGSDSIAVPAAALALAAETDRPEPAGGFAGNLADGSGDAPAPAAASPTTAGTGAAAAAATPAAGATLAGATLATGAREAPAAGAAAVAATGPAAAKPAGRAGRTDAALVPTGSTAATATADAPGAGASTPPSPAAQAIPTRADEAMAPPVVGQPAPGGTSVATEPEADGTGPIAAAPVATCGSATPALRGGKDAPASRSISEQVAMQISRSVRNGTSRFNIALAPEALGRLEIRLDFRRDGRMSAVILAESAETLQMLRNEARSLEQSLNAAGLKADASSLSFGLRTSADSAGQQPQSFVAQDSSHPARASTSGRDGETGSPAAPVPPAPGGGSGRLDIRA